MHSDLDNNKYINPPTPPKLKTDIFQAGVGCGDDLHLNSLITYSGYPLIHAGYFYLPNYEYFLAGKKSETYATVTIDPLTGNGIIELNQVDLPNQDLPPQIFISGA